METARRAKDLIGRGTQIDLRLERCADDDPAADAVYAAACRPSLLQHPAYGIAYGAHIRHHMRRMLVRVDGAVAGCALFHEARLGGILHSISLDMGPVWLPGADTPDHQRAFFMECARLFPARAGRWRRFIPAVAAVPDAHELMTQCGFRHSAGSRAATIWADLRQPLAPRRNWAAMAKRAEKQGLVVQWDEQARTLGWLLRQEGAVRRMRGYGGATAPLMRRLARLLAAEKGLLLARVLCAGRPVAGAAFVLHPPAATYLMAWTGAEGRAAGAQNLLLRDAYGVLKARGIGYLDLGGVNDEAASGVQYFKEGFGGTYEAQPGLYR